MKLGIRCNSQANYKDRPLNFTCNDIFLSNSSSCIVWETGKFNNAAVKKSRKVHYSKGNCTNYASAGAFNRNGEYLI